MSNISSLTANLTDLDLIVLCINLLIFLGSRWIVKGFKKPSDKHVSSTKLWALRTINLILFALYFLAIFETQLNRQISLTGLTLLLAFILVHFYQMFLLYKFGRVKEIEGDKYRVETYQSEVFSLLGVFLAIIVAILVIINIWDMTSWLQATSVLGALLLLTYSTKDVWAPDNINGLMLLYNGDVEPGSVVKIDELNLLGIAIQTTLTQTVFRDLRGRYRIILPNSKIRSSKIEVLTKAPVSGLREFIDFKIAYGFTSDQIEQFLLSAWKNACDLEVAINLDKPASVKLVETGDHAVTWRLNYSVKNVYRLIEARCAINKATYDLSLIEKIGLNTPSTHEVEISSKAEAFSNTAV
ncbi:MAG: mechanosensitive ion channel family protein [Methylococcales bacterium]|nr:mechanosensitive ion channel family protein [Methylococcales bacterium]